MIDQIGESAWTAIPYFLDNGADVAEIAYRAFGNNRDAHGGVDCRLIVRRVRPTPGSQLALFVTWSYHAFITNRTGTTMFLEADHRRHAVVESTIRDLKYGVGLNHLPSGRFAANAAWLALNVIAHNLAGFTTRLGALDTPTTPTPTGETGHVRAARKTFVAVDSLRRRHLRAPGRLARSARRQTLHLPRNWPWTDEFNYALTKLRSINLII